MFPFFNLFKVHYNTCQTILHVNVLYNIKRKKYKTVTNLIFFCLTRPQFAPTFYRTRGEHANHYATDAVPYFYFIFIIFLIKISYCPSIYYLKTKNSTEWSWFCIELIILFLYLLCIWIIAIFKECLNKSRNSQCLYGYQVTLIVLD
jgi:cytochrome c biogenesis factor